MALVATAGAAAPPHRSGRSIVVRRALGRVVVSVHGELDATRSTILERVLSDLIDGQGNRDVLLDLRAAQLRDATALSALRLPAEQARRRGAAFSVRGAPELS